MPGLKSFMKMGGEQWEIRRGDHVQAADGLKNTEEGTKRPYIAFYPETDVQAGDWLVGRTSANELYVVDTFTQVVHQKAFQKKAYYLTKAEYEREQATQAAAGNTTIHVGSAENSVIGVNQNAAINVTQKVDWKEVYKQIEDKGGEDQEQLETLVRELRELIDKGKPIEPGALAPFTDLLIKHAWISSPIATTILNWITASPLPR